MKKIVFISVLIFALTAVVWGQTCNSQQAQNCPIITDTSAFFSAVCKTYTCTENCGTNQTAPDGKCKKTTNQCTHGGFSVYYSCNTAYCCKSGGGTGSGGGGGCFFWWECPEDGCDPWTGNGCF